MCKFIGYVLLSTVALLGFSIIVVMIAIPVARANLSFRDTECIVLSKYILNSTTTQLSCGYLNVTYTREDGLLINATGTETIGGEPSLPYETSLEWVDKFDLNSTTPYACFYDPTNATHVLMDLPYRTVTIVLVCIAGGFMLLVPLLVCVTTYVRGARSGYNQIKFRPIS